MAVAGCTVISYRHRELKNVGSGRTLLPVGGDCSATTDPFPCSRNASFSITMRQLVVVGCAVSMNRRLYSLAVTFRQIGQTAREVACFATRDRRPDFSNPTCTRTRQSRVLVLLRMEVRRLSSAVNSSRTLPAWVEQSSLSHAWTVARCLRNAPSSRITVPVVAGLWRSFEHRWR
jgi:hypothetical protein